MSNEIRCDRCGRVLHRGELNGVYNNIGGVCSDGKPYGCFHIFHKGECGDNESDSIDRCIYCGSKDYGGSCSGRLNGGVHIHGIGSKNGYPICVYCGETIWYGKEEAYCVFSPNGKHSSVPIF